jgi:glutathione S-transferase
MLELYQAEWCPHSSKVRERMTELGLSYIARQVPAERVDREELRRKAGTDEIPTLVLEDGTAISDDDHIIAWLEQHTSERADAERHQERAEEHL